MELRSRKVSKGPLPEGDRRGASGADAGCYSMRTIGGAGLSRRAPVDKNMTAEESGPTQQTALNNAQLSPTTSNGHSRTPSVSSTESLFQTPPSSPQWFKQLSSPATVSSIVSEDVVQEADANIPAPTTGTKRARIRWTQDMNLHIWRNYLLITKLGTSKRGYLDTLHSRFCEKFSNIDVSKQRIGDQCRAIVRNNLIPIETRKEIENEVKTYLDHSTNNTIHTLTQNTQTAGTRMRWTDETNETLIRCYYDVTQNERDMTAWRQKLLNRFIEKCPHLNMLTEQRLADQKRSILKNKLISESRLQQIRNEIDNRDPGQTNHILLDQELSISYDNLLPIQPSEHNIPVTNLTQTLTPIDIHPSTSTLNLSESRTHEEEAENDLEQPTRNTYIDDNKIKEKFQNTLQKFQNTEPTHRPYIPKQKTSRKLAYIVNYIDTKLLPQHLNLDQDFITTQAIIYSAAFTAAVCNGARIEEERNVRQTANNNYIPPWQKRLQNKIQSLRRSIGRLTQYINGNRNLGVIRHIETLKNKYKIHSRHEEPNLTNEQFLDTLKQKLNAANSRLKRYLNCTVRKQQNKQFSNNERQFYRKLSTDTQNTQNTTSTETPQPDDLHQFWSGIWANPIQHNHTAEWLNDSIQNTDNIPQMEVQHIPTNIFARVLKKAHNWKAPGTDHIHNYWYKKFNSVHPYIYNHINNFIQTPNLMPEYITQGITYMIPKDNDRLNPAKYRPITCLQTIYKLLTGCLSEIILEHLTANNILCEEQKGCRRNAQGCKEQLIIDSVTMKHTHSNKKDIHTMYIDYRKAYDSVPHSWLLHVLHHYKINPTIAGFLENTMQHWHTTLKLIGNTEIQTDTIPIRRGIFQGDALSPLWFCLALNPLSIMLNSTQNGIPLNTETEHTQLSHLMYMDDIKLYSHSKDTLHQLADTTQIFSQDIQMEFGIDKCKTFSIENGRLQQHSYTLTSGERIDAMTDSDLYKYLGFQQALQIDHKTTKADLISKYKHRINSILRSRLNSRNLIKALNTYAIPVLTYSFGIIHWTQTDLQKLQTTINTKMTAHRKHHPRSCTQRLTLSRKEGGRGIIDIVNLHNRIISSLRKYFHTHAEHSSIHNAIAQADRRITPLNLRNHNTQRNERIKDPKTKIEEWRQKSLHGRHFNDLQQSHVDKTASNAWLQRGEMFPETEGFMLAIQDQVIETRNYQKHIIRLQNLPTDLCRRCHSSSETIQHITGACRSIAQTDYKHRHDQVAAIIHQNLAYKYKFIQEKVPYYKYTPNAVLENSEYRLYWDRTIITDKTIHFNRPDITVFHKPTKTVYLIDIAVCNTHNILTTHTEKIAKYTDLSIELRTQWNATNVKTIPIILSSTGVIPNTLHTSLTTLDLPKSIYILLQKAVILNTCRIVRKFLSLPV